jgi:hypothetical protein
LRRETDGAQGNEGKTFCCEFHLKLQWVRERTGERQMLGSGGSEDMKRVRNLFAGDGAAVRHS